MAGKGDVPGTHIHQCELSSCRQNFRAKAPHAKYCSAKCRAMAAYNRNHRKEGVGLSWRRACEAPGCGAMFQPDEQHHQTRYCSDMCRHRATYGRRRGGSGDLKEITVRVDRLAELDAWAQRQGLSRAEAVREAVRRLVEDDESAPSKGELETV